MRRLHDLLLPLLLLSLALSLTALPPRKAAPSATPNPSPNPKSVIEIGNARFTVIAEGIIRMEYNVEKKFDDRASFMAVNRWNPNPSFNVSIDKVTGQMDVFASTWTLSYNPSLSLSLSPENGGFSAENLKVEIRVNETHSTVWVPGLPNPTQLPGTLRTLDGVNGSLPLNCTLLPYADEHCVPGIISREGWTVVNDTATPRLVPSARTGRLWATSPPSLSLSPSYEDLYLFAHGHDYIRALQEYTSLLAGKIPLPPRFAFGSFYSRYWAFDDVEELTDIIDEYNAHSVPLDVLVTDMDWHETFYREAKAGLVDQAGQTPGWTGFTWDSALFQRPKAFMNRCKERGLKNTLNLHPASGIQPWEKTYEVMAKAMGIDPGTQQYVPFQPGNETFVDNWDELVLKGLQEIGVDFWWLDWQQNESDIWTGIDNVNPTFWLNYLFFTSPTHWETTKTRPLLLHRWGGLGNHRYQVGFSGDVHPSWASLAFQPYFTASAGNVGYAYWSHDIGGHLALPGDELYTRWVQWGSFSPIFRLHCTKSPTNYRRLWLFPYANFIAMRNTLTQRLQLNPYIYSAARRTYDTGRAMVEPLYYSFPEEENAYVYKTQYMFGETMMVSPVITPSNQTTGQTLHPLWVPPGEWIHMQTLTPYVGPQERDMYVTLDEFPVFVKSGSLIVQKTLGSVYDSQAQPGREWLGRAQEIPLSLQVDVFLGVQSAESGSAEIYEDAGDDQEYDTRNLRTTFTYTNLPTTNTLQLQVSPPTGAGYVGAPETRSYVWRVFCAAWPESVELSVGGGASTPLPYWNASETVRPPPSSEKNLWYYDGLQTALVIEINRPYSVKDDVIVTVAFGSGATIWLEEVSGLRGLYQRLHTVKEILDDHFSHVLQEDYRSVLEALETSTTMSVSADVSGIARRARELVESGVEEVREIQALPAGDKEKVVALLTQF